jgi:TonB family protein
MDWHGLALQMEEALLNGPRVRKPATVEIAFTVRADGTMSEARLHKGAKSNLDEAALQAFNVIPHRRSWQAAVKHGTPQDVTVVFPVFFKPWIKATPRRLRDKYRHPLDTLCFEFNKTAFSSSQRPVWGALVDGVFHTGQTFDILKELKGSMSSTWIITDSLTLVQCGLSTEKATIGVTTRDYEKKHGKPREVLARERAEAHPEEPRAIDPASSTWLVRGAEDLETMPLFMKRGFEKFERWAMDHGASVQAADPKQYGSVTVSFVIDEKGRICSPRIVKGLGEATDQAVLEFLLNCPAWEPARKDGRPVPVAVVCPLTFNLLIR